MKKNRKRDARIIAKARRKRRRKEENREPLKVWIVDGKAQDIRMEMERADALEIFRPVFQKSHK